MSSQHTSQHELDWLAYRYVSGELSASDAEQFEAMLLDSQPAREAVARAVELMEVIVAAQNVDHAAAAMQPVAANLERSVAGSSSISGNARPWLRVAGWLSLATAASLALLLFGRPDRRPEVASVAKPVAGPSLDELTAAWIASRPEATTDDVSEASDDTLDDLSAEVGAVADDAEFAAPSWLLAAVAGSTTQPGQISPNQGTQE